MGLMNWLGVSSPGSDMSPEDSATEDRIQSALDQLVKGSKEFGNRTIPAGQAEDILRQQGILPEGWRLRESDSTSSGYRPTKAASLKSAALHAGILGGGAVTGLGLAGIGPLAGIGGAAGAGGAGAGTGAGAGAGAGITDLGAVSPSLFGASAIAPEVWIGTGGLVAGSTAAETASALGGGGGLLGGVGSIVGGKKSLFDILGAAGQGIGAANQAADNRRLAFNDPYVQRANLEQRQRNQGMADVYRSNWYANQPRSPFNPTKPTPISPNLQQAFSNQEQYGMDRLAKKPQYDVTGFPSLEQGTLGKIGNYAGPILSTIGGLFGRR